AVLVPSQGQTVALTIDDPQAPGGRRAHEWRVPSRAECYLCHNPWAGYRLGFTTSQLAKVHDYGSGAADQLATLRHVGLIELSEEDADAEPKFVDPFDESTDLATRARSYLHVNCAHCHRFGGGGTATIDLRFEVPLGDAKMLDLRPTQGTFQIPDARILAAGDPYRSLLYYRAAKMGRGRMPYLGSQEVDERAVRLLRQWIEGMPRSEELAPSLKTRRANHLTALKRLRSDNALTKEESQKELRRLTSSTSGALLLMDLLDEDSTGKKIRKQALSSVLAESAPHVRDLFERFLPRDQRRKTLGGSVDPAAILAMKGDASAGERLFLHTIGVQCKNCHRVGKIGVAIGPDLSGVGLKNDRAKLLESILQPSKLIDPKYAAYLLETKAGQVHSGLLVEKTEARIVLRDARDKLIRVPASEVETLVPQRNSLMPELLFRDMTAQQLADLLEYLAGLKKPRSD
ncbi:MAG: c-type cytochrome, partial [Planctomycetales bacterium]